MNAFEGQSTEKEPVRMTREEFDNIRNTFGDNLENEEFQAELSRLGIELDTGPATIMVEGESMRMVTDRRDFGTVIEDENTPLA